MAKNSFPPKGSKPFPPKGKSAPSKGMPAKKGKMPHFALGGSAGTHTNDPSGPGGYKGPGGVNTGTTTGTSASNRSGGGNRGITPTSAPPGMAKKKAPAAPKKPAMAVGPAGRGQNYGFAPGAYMNTAVTAKPYDASKSPANNMGTARFKKGGMVKGKRGC